jgi:hypothetical protein
MTKLKSHSIEKSEISISSNLSHCKSSVSLRIPHALCRNVGYLLQLADYPQALHALFPKLIRLTDSNYQILSKCTSVMYASGEMYVPCAVTKK